MAKRRYIKHNSLESIMGMKKAVDRKKAERKKAKPAQSPSYVRFFEQRETAAQTRSNTKELLDKSPEKLAVDDYRQLLHEQMSSALPKGKRDNRIELLEEETDRELAEEKIKRLSEWNIKTERTPGNRQPTKKRISKERRGRKAA